MKGHVFFPGDDQLEGLLEFPQGREPVGGVVVAHPHPLYGGSMLIPTVRDMAAVARQQGFASLRFNFRGVRRSGGMHDGIRERRDVSFAVDYLRSQIPDGLPIALAGYSFGAIMCSLAVIDGVDPAALVLVSFPLSWSEFASEHFERLGLYEGPVLALSGELDHLSPPAEVDTFLRERGLQPQMAVVSGMDHFYYGATLETWAVIGEFLAESVLAGKP